MYMAAIRSFFQEMFSSIPPLGVMDIVDILVVAFLIYKLMLIIRSTSAARVARYRDTRFCGRCGTPLEHDVNERMMHCPRCGNMIFPRITTALDLFGTAFGFHSLYKCFGSISWIMAQPPEFVAFAYFSPIV